MSKKFTINSLEEIKTLMKEDSLIVECQEEKIIANPLTSSLSSPYQKGKVIMVAPEKPKPIKNDEVIPEDPFKITNKNIIFFDNSAGLIIDIPSSKNRYFLINKKDVLFITK